MNYFLFALVVACDAIQSVFDEMRFDKDRESIDKPVNQSCIDCMTNNANKYGWHVMVDACVNVTDPDAILRLTMDNYPDKPCTRMSIALALHHSPEWFPKYTFDPHAQASLAEAIATDKKAVDEYFNGMLGDSDETIDSAHSNYDSARAAIWQAVGDVIETSKPQS